MSFAFFIVTISFLFSSRFLSHPEEKEKKKLKTKKEAKASERENKRFEYDEVKSIIKFYD